MSDMIEIAYGSDVFPVRIIYSSRKTLGVSVHPDCTVFATVPEGTSNDAISEKLKRKARWIKKQVDYFNQFLPHTPPRRYVGGETHLYLGHKYRLRFVEAGAEGVIKKGDYFLVSGSDMCADETAKLMDQWYKEQATIVFQERLNKCMRLFPKSRKPELAIKFLEKRWGSMASGSVLTINIDLIRAPVECIDYVLIHELCHMEQPHHGEEFWTLLQRKLPNWRKLKHRLETVLS